jgi:hypothetical protein
MKSAELCIPLAALLAACTPATTTTLSKPPPRATAPGSSAAAPLPPADSLDDVYRRFLKKEVLEQRMNAAGCVGSHLLSRTAAGGVTVMSCIGPSAKPLDIFNLIDRNNRRIFFDGVERTFHAEFSGRITHSNASYLAMYHAASLSDGHLGTVAISRFQPTDRQRMTGMNYVEPGPYVLRGVLAGGAGTYMLAMDSASAFTNVYFFPRAGKASAFSLAPAARSCEVIYGRQSLQQLKAGDMMLVMSVAEPCRWHAVKVAAPLQGSTLAIEPVAVGAGARTTALSIGEERGGRHTLLLKAN